MDSSPPKIGEVWLCDGRRVLISGISGRTVRVWSSAYAIMYLDDEDEVGVAYWAKTEHLVRRHDQQLSDEEQVWWCARLLAESKHE